MDAWDVVLLVVMSYVAVMALVRLMLARRERLIKDLRKQLDEQVRNKHGESKETRAA